MLRIAGRQTRCQPLCRPLVHGPQLRRRSGQQRARRDKVQRPYSESPGRPYSQTGFYDKGFLDELRTTSTIRVTLRQWEDENYQPNDYLLKTSLGPGEVANQMFKSEALSSMREGRQLGETDDEVAVDETGSVESLVVAPTEHLVPGTLIELRLTDSRVPILAILLGRFYGVYYFFTNGNQLMADTEIPSVLFSVADFASPSEIQALIDFIPKDRHVPPIEVADKHQPPIGLGLHLHEKMASFVNKTNFLYQHSMSSLSAANKKLPWPTEFRTLSLYEIADTLVPEAAGPNGQYDPALLYAIHTGLLSDDTDTFRALNQISRGKHSSYLYRVSPASSIQAIVQVRFLIRDIMEKFGGSFPFKRPDRPGRIDNHLWRFISRARHVIKLSRQNRSWTDHGVLAPHHDRYPCTQDWTSRQKVYIRFVELWASNQFRRGSVLHSMGSAILRLTGMYGDARMLNASAGWTFLQELGWIPSWEVSTRYRFPLPGAAVRPGGGYIRPDPGPYQESMRDDIAAEYRKDWGPLKAYCIDAPTSTLLDDAVSIEPTETPGEHWIHVHSADPTAFIQPHSKLAEFAAIVAMDHYLPGYRYSMFPQDFSDEVVMKQLSLDNGRPCLTFSTRLNEAGEVLDSKIQPGRLQNITFISPEELEKICPPLRAAAEEPSGPCSLYVGPPQDVDSTPNRKMTTAEDLSPDEKSDLQTMHHLLSTVDANRLKAGAVRQSRPARSVRVMFDGKGDLTPENCPPDTDSWPGDPAIELSIHSQHDGTLVSMAMTLAGNSAAKWCDARGIPVPYHSQPGPLRNPGAMRALADKIHDLMDKNEPVPRVLWQLFDREAGPSAMDVVPSPVMLMGLDMYTKVTSPLRRLSDCLAHWQIHAYLANHPPTGQPTPVPVDPTDLPWSRTELRSKLDALRLSTYTSRSLARMGTQTWAHQAFLRAWKFGEAALPRTFAFTARDVYTHLVHGELDFLGYRAVLSKASLEGVALMSEVSDGQVFEVEVTDVDAYRCIVYVRALRWLKHKGEVDEGAPDVTGVLSAE